MVELELELVVVCISELLVLYRFTIYKFLYILFKHKIKQLFFNQNTPKAYLTYLRIQAFTIFC